jgi:hypothetical protein
MRTGIRRCLIIASSLLALSCGSQGLEGAPSDGSGGIASTAGMGGTVQSAGGSGPVATGGQVASLGTGGVLAQAGSPATGGVGAATAGAGGVPVADGGPDSSNATPDSALVGSGGIGGRSGSIGAGGGFGGTGIGGGGGSRDGSMGAGDVPGGGGTSPLGGAGANGAGGTVADGGGTSHSDGGGGARTCMGTSIVASEVNDYSFSSTLSFPPVRVAPKSNLQFDWSGVTADLGRHAVDPKKDLNTILVFEWDLNLVDFQTSLNADTLASRDLTLVPPLSFTTDGRTTSARLLDFTFNGAPIGGGLISVEQVMLFFDPSEYDPSTHTFTVMAATGSVLGQGTRMIQTFLIDPNSTNTLVAMTGGSSRLDFQADLTSLVPTTIPAGQARIAFDWGKMTTNAMGGDFGGENANRITSAFIGHFQESASELSGAKFLDLEQIAIALYRQTVDSGTSVDLSAFKDSNGRSFAGIDSTGTWLFGLQCGDCRNPAPWYITVLRPCE